MLKACPKRTTRRKLNEVFDEDIDILCGYSLITTTVDSDTFEMHALVQFCTQAWLSSSSDLQNWNLTMIELVAREFPTGDYENWVKCQQLLPHVESIAENEPAGDESVRLWAKLLSNMAWYIWMTGSYKQAQIVSSKAVMARERLLGQNDMATLLSVSILAAVLQYQGKYDEAERLNWRALEEREEKLGQQHPDTLMSVYSQAFLLQKMKRYQEASPLYQKACAGFKEKLDSQHPATIACRRHYSSLQIKIAAIETP